MKAKELIDKFSKPFLHKDTEGFEYTIVGKEIKECALIAVDEILDERFSYRQQATKYNNERLRYWNQVKDEINKL